MILDGKFFLRRPFQVLTDARYETNSPRFWRRELNPQFDKIFDADDFKLVLKNVNQNTISYKLSDAVTDAIGERLFDWFSGYRFAAIPTKMPQSPKMFMADLYFALMDILPAISFTDYPLIEDDFNLVFHEAQAGKIDTAKVGTNEQNTLGNKDETKADILTNTNLSQTNTADIQNIDEEGWQNNKTINDVFLSPQNSGVTPTTENLDSTISATPKDKRGVNGIPNPSEAPYTTNTTKQNFGESNKNQSNTSAQSQTGLSSIQQNNDIRTANEKHGEMVQGQEQENTHLHSNDYKETLDFNKGARLQDFYNLVDNRLWMELLARLQTWIVQADIAGSDRSYADCPLYPEGV